jgi:SOS-response transcriptional repressor LexA
MSPTLSNGDIVLVSTRARAQPGDVVLVRWPARPAQLSVKRAVRRMAGGWFVVGDNRFGSTDSHDLGAAEVLGVVRWRLWPRPGRLRRGTGPGELGGPSEVEGWPGSADRGTQ